jgi:hypothetical protein
MIDIEDLTVALRLAILRLNDEFSHVKSLEILENESDRYIQEAQTLIANMKHKPLKDWQLCNDCHGYGLCEDWCLKEND